MDTRLVIVFCTILLLGFFFIQKGKAQFKKTASCINPIFDKKVNSYLSYSAPVIDVRDAFSKKNEYLFLDAREKKEFQVSYIEGATWVGYDDFDFDKVKSIPKDKAIIVYCSIGYRSEKIATKLRKAGYSKVYNLYGSIFEWVNRGYPVVSGSIPVKKIHTYNKTWSRWVDKVGFEKIY